MNTIEKIFVVRMKLNALIVGMKLINPVCNEIKFDNGTLTITIAHDGCCSRSRTP